MKKRYVIMINIILLLWYFLAMIGVKFNERYLVTRSFQDDWIFMLIPIVTFTIFLFTQKVGKIIHVSWLLMWFVTQFLSHEWYTIFGAGFMGDKEGKINYFKDCIQLVSSEKIYVPDVYHIILHVFIVIALITTIICRDEVDNNNVDR